jgi:hypothetical protein
MSVLPAETGGVKTDVSGDKAVDLVEDKCCTSMIMSPFVLDRNVP